MRLRTMLSVTLAALSFSAPQHARAWHDEGHVYSATAAVRALPDDVPAFFREAERTVAHCALDPDIERHDALPQLKAATSPEHYLDWGYLGDRKLPATRAEFIALCAELDLPPERVGYLPYALTEATQRLALAFAEHRADPSNEHVRMKCLVYAGRLAHYAADLHMPLHTTVHWDGRAGADFESPRTGIHVNVDALPTKIPFDELFATLPEPKAHDDVFALVRRELKRSNALVDRVYELKGEIPAWDDVQLESEAVRAFTRGRMQAAAKLIASLHLTAWRLSADLSLPDWHDRTIYDAGFDESRIPPQPHVDE